MELQWPLIIFTTLVAWSAGLFAAQAALALKGEARKGQMPALIISAILLAVGGIAVFFHLQHWERIFNGFGHITSGITHELIFVVVLAVVMVVYFALLRKGDGTVPAWLAVVAIVVAAALVIVMAHSYLMPSRRAWDSPLWIACVLGNACVLGPATLAVICEVAEGAVTRLGGRLALIGSVANGITSVAYTAFLALAGSAFSGIGYYYDNTHPLKGLYDEAVASPFAGDNLVPMVLGVIVVGIVASIACAAVGFKRGNWRIWGTAAALCAFVGALCMRVVFYQMGASVFMYL